MKIKIKHITYIKDLGNIKTEDGHKVRSDLLYRSSNLSRLTPKNELEEKQSQQYSKILDPELSIIKNNDEYNQDDIKSINIEDDLNSFHNQNSSDENFSENFFGSKEEKETEKKEGEKKEEKEEQKDNPLIDYYEHYYD